MLLTRWSLVDRRVPSRAGPARRTALTTRHAGNTCRVRIVSLVPSATEMLFALGVGDEVTAVTHECDHPPEVLELPRITRDVIGPGLPPDEIDRAVRELTEQGRAIYELDERALQSLAPDLIVTQALCAVCAVSYDDVRAIAERMDPRPRWSRSTRTRSARCSATCARSRRRPAPRTRASTSSRTPRRGSTACGSPCATRRRSRSRRSSGSTPSSSPATGRRS